MINCILKKDILLLADFIENAHIVMSVLRVRVGTYIIYVLERTHTRTVMFLFLFTKNPSTILELS